MHIPNQSLVSIGTRNTKHKRTFIHFAVFIASTQIANNNITQRYIITISYCSTIRHDRWFWFLSFHAIQLAKSLQSKRSNWLTKFKTTITDNQQQSANNWNWKLNSNNKFGIAMSTQSNEWIWKDFYAFFVHQIRLTCWWGLINFTNRKKNILENFASFWFRASKLKASDSKSEHLCTIILAYVVRVVDNCFGSFICLYIYRFGSGAAQKILLPNFESV